MLIRRTENEELGNLEENIEEDIAAPREGRKRSQAKHDIQGGLTKEALPDQLLGVLNLSHKPFTWT